MKNLFKISKENDNYQTSKKVPDILFQDNTHCHIPAFSRLSLSFEQMLNISPARQMFLRYLRVERRQAIFLCFRELLLSNKCNDNCHFNYDFNNKESDENMKCIIDSIDSDTCDDDMVINREKMEFQLEQYCKKMENISCHFITIYMKYFSITARESFFDSCSFKQCFEEDETHVIYKMLIDIFKEIHQKPILSFQTLEKNIYNTLWNIYNNNYINSSMHYQYQLQHLNSGLNNLKLSDFIYSSEYIMIITEFLDLKGLADYLAFLLAVINLSGNGGKCSFNDALDVYSKFLVMDSSHFIDLPATVTNSVVNQMCQLNTLSKSTDDFIIIPNVVFEHAFRPVYLFLEQYWLPEFLASSTYQKSVSQLNKTIHTNQLRQRNHSENISSLAVPVVSEYQLPDDSRSDLSVDNTSVHSEPVLSTSIHVDNNLESHIHNHSWWPSKRLENRFPSSFHRPMSLGSFDDLGRYQSLMSNNKQITMPNSTSSEILTTITELGSDLWNKLNTNTTTEIPPSPDEIARQIINDVHVMTLRNL